MKSLKIILLFTVLLGFKLTSAQCDSIAVKCAKHVTDGFVSDGQSYRALLLSDEVAEFHATFYGGTDYRIAGCSGTDDGNLLYRVFDEDRNLIFTNEEFDNSPYWDFKVTSTLNVIIEAQLNPMSASSGCAILVIGFKQ